MMIRFVLRRALPAFITCALLCAGATSALAFCVSGVCFSDFRPTSSSSPRSSNDSSWSPPAYSGPSQEEVQREKERQEREARLEAARQAHASAMGYAQRGDWVHAVEQFRVALDNDPGNAGVEKNLALARRLQKDEPVVHNIFRERELDDMQQQARRLMSQGTPGAKGDGSASLGDSAVDLRFMGDRPLIVDPRTVSKRGQKIPPQPAVTSFSAMPAAQKERFNFLLQTRREEDTRRKGERLINPLREPERYAEWLEREKEDAKDAVTKEMTERILKKVKREQYEKALDRALNAFVESENQARALGFYQAHLDFQDELVQLRKRFGMKDYSNVYRQDREGRNRGEVERLLLKDVEEQREMAQENLEFRRARDEASDRVTAKMLQQRENVHRRDVAKLLESLKRLEKR